MRRKQGKGRHRHDGPTRLLGRYVTSTQYIAGFVQDRISLKVRARGVETWRNWAMLRNKHVTCHTPRLPKVGQLESPTAIRTLQDQVEARTTVLGTPNGWERTGKTDSLLMEDIPLCA
jgi:hypothetical protein